MKKQRSLVSVILEDLLKSKSKPLLAPYKFIYSMKYLSPDEYLHKIWQMQKRGIVKVVEKNNQKFLKITNKGELQILLEKAQTPRPNKWDGKWRVIIFDIPEDSRDKRDLLRSLLRKNEFYKLQASVFISPYPLNREAVVYLKQTGLIDYIRLLRADDIDDDKALRKIFNLK